jgi:dimethylamine/trimethylamine dehydrogenase
VGAGPAGLEAAHILGKRGYRVSLAESAEEAGGRVARESRLPGLTEWARVRDYRLTQIRALENVSLYLGSRLSAADVREFGADHVFIATGARWRRDGLGRTHVRPLGALPATGVLTPDDILDGARPSGRVAIFDDDHYYMGPVIARLLAAGAAQVTYITSAGVAGEWSHYTGEQDAVQRELLSSGVEVVVSTSVAGFDGEAVTLECVFTGEPRRLAADAVVLITSREPQDALYRELVAEDEGPGEPRIRRIGDCLAPALIAHAVYSGHKAARELDEEGAELAVRRDRARV